MSTPATPGGDMSEPRTETTIVERLRRYFLPPTQRTVAIEVRLIQEAADEIEALQEAVRIFTHDSGAWPAVVRGSDVDAAIIRALAPDRLGNEDEHHCILGCVNERSHRRPTECVACPICNGSSRAQP